MKRWTAVVSVAAGLGLLLLAGLWTFAMSQRSVETATLRIGLNIWPGYGAFFIADEKGFFKSEGINVELKMIQNDPEREAALIGGQLDGIGMTIDNLVILRDRGVKVRAVYKYDGSAGADGIVVRNEFKGLRDLKGKKVGWALGTTSHFFLAVALAEAGLRTADLQHVGLSSDDAGTAFAAGHLDGAATWEPWLTKAKESGKGHAIITTRELPVIEDVLFFREEVLRNRRATIVKFLRACFLAVAYWKANPEEAITIIAKRLDMQAGEVQDMLGGIAIMNLEDNRKFFGDGSKTSPAHKAYELAVKIWKAEGVVKTPQTAQNALDNTFLQELGK